MAEASRPLTARERELITLVSEACASLPEVRVERDGFGHSSFRVGKRTFVMIGQGRDGEGSLSIKADVPSQGFLVRRGPYVRTPYIGQHGWVTVWGNVAFDPGEVGDLVRDAYRLVAPKRLLRALEP